MTNPVNLLRAYFRVSRFEYFPGEIPGLLIPLFLAATGFKSLLNWWIFEGIFIFALLYLSGFIINSLTDTEVDKKYKKYISSSVRVLGKRTLVVMLVIHLTTAVMLTLHLAYVLTQPVLLLLVGVGIFCGLGYSVKPLQFKVRGFLSVITLGLSAFFIPGCFLYTVVAGWPPFPVLLIFFGFAVLAYGIELGNQAGDWLEDRDTGLATPPVKWGLSRSLVIGMIMSFVGFTILVGGLLWRIYTFETTVPNTFLIACAVVPIVLGAGYYFPTKGMLDLYRISRKGPVELGDDYEVKINRMIKKRLRYPRWQASGLYGFLIITILMFAAVGFFQTSGDGGGGGPSDGTSDYSSVCILSVELSSGPDQQGNADIALWIDINETHEIDELYVNCLSTLGREVLENDTYKLADIMISDITGDGLRVGMPLKVHEMNDTQFAFRLYHQNADGGMELLDSETVQPGDEMFITNVSYTLLTGVVRDTLIVEVSVYNRLYRRVPESLSVVASGNKQLILPVSVSNNGTVEPNSYWDVPAIVLDIPKTSGTYDVKLQYNGEVQDLVLLNT